MKTRPGARRALVLGIWGLTLGLASPAVAQAPASLSILGQRSEMPGGPARPDPFAVAHERLAPEHRAQFDALMNMTVPARPDVATPFQRRGAARPAARKLTAAEQDALQSLLVDRTLFRTATGETTILAHLAALASCTPADARSTMSGPGLALDLIRMLEAEDLTAAMRATDALARGGGTAGHPLPGGLGEITQCTVHFTCGAASVQVWLRLNQPADVVRITRELFCSGQARLSDSKLKPARYSQVYHAGDRIYENERFQGDAGSEDRCDLDILLQSALMDKIALGNLSAYDVYADSGGIGNVMDGNSGSQPMYLAREMERLTGRSFAYAHNLSLGGFARFWANLRRRTPQDELVQLAQAQARAGKHLVICFQTKPSDSMALHYVTVVGYDAASETFYYADTCEPKAERAKMYRLTKADMLAKLRCVVYPR